MKELNTKKEHMTMVTWWSDKDELKLHYYGYAKAKQHLIERNLSADEYEIEIKKLADRLGI